MLSLAERALGPSSTIEENLLYLSSVKYSHTFRTENISVLVEQIKDKVSSTEKRFEGLHYLEFALKENEDVYGQARWILLLHDILREPVPYDLKEQACKILIVVLGILKKDPVSHADDIKKFASSICPILLSSAESTIEWRESAIQCLIAAIKVFPTVFVAHKDFLLKLVIEKFNSISSKHFEIYAELFACLPLIEANAHPEFYQESWTQQYLYLLNTMNHILNQMLSFIPIDSKFAVEECNTFMPLYLPPPDVFSARSNQVREFVNLCQCISKMLSTKSKHIVQIPHERTLECIKRLFPVELLKKLEGNSLENQILLSHIHQLQMACLTILEPLLANFNSIAYNAYVVSILRSGLSTSQLGNNLTQAVSQHRHMLWKITRIWLSAKGPTAALWIVRYPTIVQELLEDISVKRKTSQVSDSPTPAKSKKSLVKSKDSYINPNMVPLTKEALKALTEILYKGCNFIKKDMRDNILKSVIHIAYEIHPSEDFPHPYTDEKCRKCLYEVLAALTVISKATDTEVLHCLISIFNNGLQDPHYKVTSVCMNAAATCRLISHPKKPTPLMKIQSQSEERERTPEPKGIRARYRELNRDDPCVENIPPAPSVEDRVSEAYHQNDTEMQSSDFPRIESHYSNATSEGQCNGDDILEIAQTSREDADDSDEGEEDEEDEDEEEEEEEEEMTHEVDLPPDHMYIPSSSNELYAMTPAHSNPEEILPTSDEVQLEELAPVSSGKVMANLVSVNDSNLQHNGVDHNVPEEVPSESTQNVSTENGLYCGLSEEEEMEDEELKEEEESWSEEVVSFPGEKRVPDFGDALAKKPKLEEKTPQNESQSDEMDEDERSGADSPTMEEMKADFVLSDGEEAAPIQSSQ